MKRRQLLAGVLTIVLTVSSSMQTAGLHAFAAENAETGITEEASAMDTGSDAAEEGTEAVAGNSESNKTDAGDAKESDTAVTAKETNESGSGSENTDTGASTGNATEDSETGVSKETAGPSDDRDLGEEGQTDSIATDESAAEEEGIDDGNDEAMTAEDVTEVEEESEEETIRKEAGGAHPIPFGSAKGMTLGSTMSGEIMTYEEEDSIYYNCYYFTAAESGVYTFSGYTTDFQWDDLVGTVYDTDYNTVASDRGEFDYDESMASVSTQIHIEAGETYYWVLSIGGSDYAKVYAKVEKDDVDFICSRVGSKNRSVAPKTETTLSVNAYSTQSISYQWLVDDEVIEGESDSSFSFVPISECTVVCNVLDQDGNVLGSVDYTITIDNKLSVITEETNRRYAELFFDPDDTATLHVIANALDLEGITYQWYKNDNIIEGAESDSLAIVADRNSTYSCEVHDLYGGTSRADYNIYINNSLSVTVDNLEEHSGGMSGGIMYYKPNSSLTITAHVSAADTTGLKYKWLINDGADSPDTFTELEGDTIELVVNNPVNYTYYELTVIDRFGNSVRKEFDICVDNGFGLTIEDGDGGNNGYYKVHAGETVNLKAVVKGEVLDGVKYTWTKYINPDVHFIECDGEEEIEGVNAPEMTVTPTSCREWYELSARDSFGGSARVRFYITVVNDLKAYPDGNEENNSTADIRIEPGKSAILKTNVSSYDDNDVQYQWYEDDEVIEGETAAQLSYAVNHKGNYYCQIRNSFGHSAKAFFNVTVDNQLIVRHEGEGDAVVGRKTVYTDPGKTVNLHTEASAVAGELTYKWSMNGEQIEGADTDSYQALGDKTAVYRCTVSDEYGNSGYVEFRVVINAQLAAYAEGTDNQSIRFIDTEPATGTILKVNAVSDSSDELHYEWYKGSSDHSLTELIERQNNSSYTLTKYDLIALPEYNRFICVVTDAYGNTKTVEFVFQNTNILFKAYPENAPVNSNTVHINADPITGKAELKTIVESNDSDLEYQWYLGEDPDEEITGETSDTLEVTVDSPTAYCCRVRNSIGMSSYARFFVMTHQFSVHAAEEVAVYEKNTEVVKLHLQPGEQYILKPIVEADDTCQISYKWRADNKYVDGENSKQIVADKNHVYICSISDQYGNSYFIRYEIYVCDITITVDGAERSEDDTQFIVYKRPDESKPLTCHVDSASGDEISIEWIGKDTIYDVERKLGTGSGYTITSNEYTEYWLTVSSKYYGGGFSELLEVRNNYLRIAPLSSKVMTQYGQKWGYESVQTGKSINLQTELDAYDDSDLTYSWYEILYNDGVKSSADWYILPSHTGSIEVTPDADTDYVCVVRDQYGNESSAYFHVSTTKEGEAEEITILQHPQSAEVLPGEQVTMSVMAVGDDLNYQWQWSSDGENWNNCAGSGYNTDTFAFTMKALYNGRRYRCAVSRGDETAYTNAATATMKALEITRNPADAEAQPGEQVTMTVEAEGGNLTYQWQWSSDGETWKNCTSGGYNTDTFAFAMKAAYDGRQYRCKVTRDSETVYSAAATATLKALGIIRNPEDAEVSIGEQVTMMVMAEGDHLNYQWQWSSDGETWNNCFAEGYNTDTFSFVMKAAYNGRQYRCKVARDNETVYSTAATASLKALSITRNPEDVSVLEGEEVRMTVEAEGGDLSYQWQWSSNGETWNNCLAEGYNTDTFVFTMKAAYDGRQYRCAVTRGSETEYSQPGTATLKPVEFTLQPADTEAAAGEQVILTVEAEGENLSYQWQWSSDGETWKNCMGASYNTSAFMFTMKALYSGRQYRCMVTRGTQKGYSDAATVTIKQ